MSAYMDTFWATIPKTSTGNLDAKYEPHKSDLQQTHNKNPGRYVSEWQPPVSDALFCVPKYHPVAYLVLTHWLMRCVKFIQQEYVYKIILRIDILSTIWEIGLRWVP